MKKYLLIIQFLICASIAYPQDIQPQELLKSSFEVVNEKGANGKFKGQILKGKRNGMGFLLYRRGALFVGDFYRDNISGYGMLISNKDIDNCTNCRTYVGNWKDGKKKGYGTCYASNGNIIYRGQFANDKPTDEYPSKANDSSRRLALIELSNENYYIGETINNLPDGFGMLIFSNGDLWQSSFKEGNRKGIGLYMANNGEWETMSFKGEEYSVVSSSENYRNMEAIRKANFRNAFSDAMGYFGKATEMGVGLAGEMSKSSRKESTANDIQSSASDTGMTGPVKGASSSSTKTSGTNHANWSSLERSYSNYESRIGILKEHSREDILFVYQSCSEDTGLPQCE